MKKALDDDVVLLEHVGQGTAAMARDLLRAEGIPCLIRGGWEDQILPYEWHKAGFPLSPDVLVPRAALERARQVLRDAWGELP